MDEVRRAKTKRDELVIELSEVMEVLYTSAKINSKDLAVFLHQAINTHADEGMLARILHDVKKSGRKLAKP